MRPQDLISETPKIDVAVRAQFLHRVRPKHSVAFEQSAQYLEQSVAAYENALTIFTPEANPYYNEIARRNLEQAKTTNSPDCGPVS